MENRNKVMLPDGSYMPKLGQGSRKAEWQRMMKSMKENWRD